MSSIMLVEIGDKPNQPQLQVYLKQNHVYLLLMCYNNVVYIMMTFWYNTNSGQQDIN